jgi:hypothetical protein
MGLSIISMISGRLRIGNDRHVRRPEHRITFTTLIRGKSRRSVKNALECRKNASLARQNFPGEFANKTPFERLLMSSPCRTGKICRVIGNYCLANQLKIMNFLQISAPEFFLPPV